MMISISNKQTKNVNSQCANFRGLANDKRIDK